MQMKKLSLQGYLLMLSYVFLKSSPLLLKICCYFLFYVQCCYYCLLNHLYMLVNSVVSWSCDKRNKIWFELSWVQEVVNTVKSEIQLMQNVCLLLVTFFSQFTTILTLKVELHLKRFWISKWTALWKKLNIHM